MRPTLADGRLLSLSWCNKVLRDACDRERKKERERERNFPEWIVRMLKRQERCDLRTNWSRRDQKMVSSGHSSAQTA